MIKRKMIKCWKCKKRVAEKDCAWVTDEGYLCPDCQLAK